MKRHGWSLLWGLVATLGVLIYGEVFFKVPADNLKAAIEVKGVGLSMVLAGVVLFAASCLPRSSFLRWLDFVQSRPILFLFLFSALYFAVRLPFYTIPFFEEDSYHAHIFLTRPVAPEYFLYGRIDGNELHMIPAHPAMTYELLAQMGSFVGMFIDLSGLSDAGMVFVSRFGFSLFQYSFWLLLLLIYFASTRVKAEQSNEEVRFLLTGLIVMAVSPLAIQNSIDLQTDNTAGIWLNGLFFLLFWTRHRFQIPRIWFAIGLFIASFLVGFGKNEWSLAFIAAAALFPVIAWIGRKWWGFSTSGQSSLGIALLAVAGCGLGNWLSYFLWPVNYLGGWEVFRNFSSKGNIAGSYGFSRWLEVAGQRFPYLFPVYSLIFVIACAAAKKKITGDQRNLLPLLYAGTFFGGYFLSSWGAYPRYFSTALIGWTLIFAIYHRAVLSSFNPRRLGLLFAFIAVTSSFYISQGWAEMFLRQKLPQPIVESSQQQECIPVMGITETYTRNKPNYVDFNVPLPEAQAWAGKFGRTVCDIKK